MTAILHVLQVTATAPDPSVPITYSLGGYLVDNPDSGAGFSINQNGQVYVTQPDVDRDLPEGNPVWQLNVIAEVPGSSLKGYGVINIRPTDVNDNGPVFDTCCMVGNILENNAASKFRLVYLQGKKKNVSTYIKSHTTHLIKKSHSQSHHVNIRVILR